MLLLLLLPEAAAAPCPAASAIFTPNSPWRAIFASIASELAWITSDFVATISSKEPLAISSFAVKSARAFSIVSLICDKMPVIWPLAGT